MEGRHHEVTGERGLEGDARGLAVADFAHEDDVRILSEDGAQADGEGEASARVDLPCVSALISTSMGSSRVTTLTRFVSMSAMHE